MDNFEDKLEGIANAMQQEFQNKHNERILSDIKRFQNYQEERQKSLQVWLRFLVATSGTLFAILISLGNKTELTVPAQQVYGLAIASLGMSTVMLCIKLYEHPFLAKKKLKHFLKEVEKARNEHRQTSSVLGYKTIAIFGVCEKIGYVFLIVAVLLLVGLSLLVYVV